MDTHICGDGVGYLSIHRNDERGKREKNILTVCDAVTMRDRGLRLFTPTSAPLFLSWWWRWYVRSGWHRIIWNDDFFFAFLFFFAFFFISILVFGFASS